MHFFVEHFFGNDFWYVFMAWQKQISFAVITFFIIKLFSLRFWNWKKVACDNLGSSLLVIRNSLEEKWIDLQCRLRGKKWCFVFIFSLTLVFNVYCVLEFSSSLFYFYKSRILNLVVNLPALFPLSKGIYANFHDP